MSRPGVAGSRVEPYTYLLQRTPQPPAPRKRKRHDSFDRTSDGTDGAARQEGRPRALGCRAAAKTKALRALAALLIERQPDILKANALDVDAAKAANMDAPRLDRLTLTPRIMADMADACLHIAEMADEVGVIEQQWQRPNGLMIGKMRIPLGVIAMIFESRPNVTIDAAILCLKAGDAVILRGGSEAIHSNLALAGSSTKRCAAPGCPRMRRRSWKPRIAPPSPRSANLTNMWTS